MRATRVQKPASAISLLRSRNLLALTAMSSRMAMPIRAASTISSDARYVFRMYRSRIFTGAASP